MNEQQKTNRIRKAELNIVVGINGTGKTTFLQENIVKQSEKALVVTPDYAEWNHLPEITYKDIRHFNGQARIVYEDTTTLEMIRKHYYGGALILDDAMAYLTEQTPAMLQYLYIRRRQFGIDLYIVGHGLRQIPPKCFTFASFLVLFNTTENFTTRKKELQPDIYDKIIETQNRIKKKVEAGNPYYYEIILLDPQIKGLYAATNK